MSDDPGPARGPTDGPGRDPGLQPERTRLAWRRTALSMSVVALLSARLALTRGGVGIPAVAVALVGWLVTLALLLPRLTARGAARPAPQPGRADLAVPLSALVAAGYAALGTMIVFDSLG